MLAHVLPSFDAETRIAVLARVADALSPDGVLLLGGGETLPEGCDSFTLEAGVARKLNATRAAA
jgi:chemotaxis methyl-accepting protein methylase